MLRMLSLPKSFVYYFANLKTNKSALTSNNDLHRVRRRSRALQIVRRAPVDALMLCGDLREEK